VGAQLDRNRAAVGEQVVLTVSVSGEARDVGTPQLPELADFEVYGGGQSQRFSFVNGQVSANYGFTYYLRPRRAGTYDVGAVRIDVDGKEYRTSPLRLEVTTAGAGTGPSPPAPSTPPESSGGRDYFVTMTVDRDSVVVGEQIVLTFAFYRASRSSIFDSPEYKPPTTEGFWREDLPPERHGSRVIRSRLYQFTEISYALFPTRAGDLTIGEATVRVPEDLFSSVFRSRRRRGDIVLRADPIQVHARPLPSGAPSEFAGTVASDLRLDVSVDRRELEAGEALTLSMRLEGDGYIPGAQPAQFDAPPGFRVHDAGSSSDSRPVGGRLHGVLSVEKLVIPQSPGDVQLPGVRYVYFDTRRGEYRSLQSEPIALRVRPSEGTGQSVFAGAGKSEIELLARDILHIRPVRGSLSPHGGLLPLRPLYWGMLAVPGLAWLASSLLLRRQRRLRADPARLRAARALGAARRRLGDSDPPDRRVAEALRGYVADKADRARAGMSNDEILQWLSGREADPQAVLELGELLEDCDRARYAPSTAELHELLPRAERLLERLERGGLP
jgi:hypothetical protein